MKSTIDKNINIETFGTSRNTLQNLVTDVSNPKPVSGSQSCKFKTNKNIPKLIENE